MDGNPLEFDDLFGLSGKAQPGKLPPTWNSTQNLNSAFLKYNNCYSYALNRFGREGSFYSAGGLDPGEISGKKYGKLNCEEILAAVRRDGGVNVREDKTCPAGFHASELFIRESRRWGPRGDYHWYRQDSDGSWSQKIGGAASRILEKTQRHH